MSAGGELAAVPPPDLNYPPLCSILRNKYLFS